VSTGAATFRETGCARKKSNLGCARGWHLQSIYRERKMAFIATISAVGTFIGAAVFSLWLLKELFAGK
jgi:hypothetical protein